ncbi:hypothetical protein B9Z55_028929 [Caenorhabditis nigoni]|nr:hypothetical protein B9Z55_028929 [Caenorhabditis nigoni]
MHAAKSSSVMEPKTTLYALISIRNDGFETEPNPNSELMKSLVRYAPQVNAIFVVLIPVILVIIFNVMLILTLRRSPSAFVTFLSFYIQKDWFTLRSICTILVVLGKALNFVLFCLTSASFRQRLMEQLNSRKSTRYTSVATH